MTKDMNLTQLLEDWIGEDDSLNTEKVRDGHYADTIYARNRLKAELRASLPSLLAKIEQHVLEARKDEARTWDSLILEGIIHMHEVDDSVGQAVDQIVSRANVRILEIDALLNTKGTDDE